MTNKLEPNGNKQDDPESRILNIVDEVRMPIVEERVVVSTKTIEGERVTVTTRPIVERINITEKVARDHVSVERISIGKVVETVPPVREEGDVTIIPVVEERMRVVIDLILTEEIHLRRSRTTEQAEAVIDLHKTEVSIDRSEGG